MFQYNPNYVKRDFLLDLNCEVWEDGDVDKVIRVAHIPLTVLKKLLEEKFINPNGRQNRSPSTQEFLSFIEKYPVITAHGYVVSPYRDDYRVTVEGLFVDWADVTPEIRDAFLHFCENADRLDTDGDLYSWWD